MQVVHWLIRFYFKSASLWWFNYAALAASSLTYFICYGSLHLSAGRIPALLHCHFITARLLHCVQRMALDGVLIARLAISEPTFNAAGELVDGGTDISMKGMCE